jgi:hypothetical protein
MFLTQSLGWCDPMRTEVANQLAHIESELCWCDSIVEINNIAKRSLSHKEVTWH